MMAVWLLTSPVKSAPFKRTVTIWPFSTPVVATVKVPPANASAVFKLLPQLGVTVVMVGDVLSTVSAVARDVAALVLPAASVCLTWTALAA